MWIRSGSHRFHEAALFLTEPFSPLHNCCSFPLQGTMEEKIYDRQVTKQSLSYRVVDQQQIERHFTLFELKELYTFEPDLLNDPNSKKSKRTTSALPKVTPLTVLVVSFFLPWPLTNPHMTNLQYGLILFVSDSQDQILTTLLETCKDQIVSYHEHESLLDHKQEEELSEAERKAAWAEYEAEVRSCTLQSSHDHDQRHVRLSSHPRHYTQHFTFIFFELTLCKCVFLFVSSVKNSQPSSQLGSGHLRKEDQWGALGKNTQSFLIPYLRKTSGDVSDSNHIWIKHFFAGIT